MELKITDSIVLREAVLSDLSELEVFHREAEGYFSFDPSHSLTPPEICLKEGDLPPGGKRENFSVYMINVDASPSGYLTLYRGYPDGETVYLCFFYLSGSVRRKGVGSQTVGALCGALREKGFVRARVAVSLKNWPGIRFWQTCGFGRITKVSFDAPFSAENYGCLELEKVL